LRALGGEVVTGWRVDSVDELPPAPVVLLDVAPRALLRLAGHRFPARYRRALERFRHGPGVFKIDWALEGPIPWRAEGCHRAGTVHVGGPLPEVAAAEDAVWRDRVPDDPFVVLAQQSRFDDTRAPGGSHTGWAYCHVPHGCSVDMTDGIERQVERFAPGFRDRVLARAVAPPAAVERRDPNCVGGDITGGVLDVAQAVTRPAARLVPWTTPDPGLYLCSSSTPPGGGVHGMCGNLAARAALRRADW
ncbi:MAG: FAD-dependent oxidoreductase, partial [Actinomycetota bacterium]|nr:FAD-dependent oxidoreductase [Actinomycetota bacterium]